MRGPAKSVMVIGALAVLGGCATVPKEAGFPDVREDVRSRTGYEVRWYQGAPEEARAADSLRALLADSLTVEEAVQIALLNNRRLQATYEDLGVAQADVVQAGLLRNPIFSSEVGFHAEGGAPNLGFGVALEFLDIFYMPLRRDVARSTFETAKLRVAGEVLDLTGQVRAAYYQAQAGEQLLELWQSVLTASEAGYETSRALFEAGNVPAFDLQSEQALFEQARLGAAAAALRVAESRERLNRLLGLWGPSADWAISRRLPSLPPDSLVLVDIESRAVAASLDLAAARQEIETFGRSLGVQRVTSLVPDLEVGGIAEREEGEWKRGPEVALPIPLFDQGQARVARARAELRRRQEEYVAIAVDVRSAARSARTRLDIARQLAAHYQAVVLPLQASITREAQLQYNAMQIGVFQLLQARQQEILVGQRFIEALNAYWEARTDVDLLLAGRLAGLDDGSGTIGVQNGASAADRDGGH